MLNRPYRPILFTGLYFCIVFTDLWEKSEQDLCLRGIYGLTKNQIKSPAFAIMSPLGKTHLSILSRETSLGHFRKGSHIDFCSTIVTLIFGGGGAGLWT